MMTTSIYSIKLKMKWWILRSTLNSGSILEIQMMLAIKWEKILVMVVLYLLRKLDRALKILWFLIMYIGYGTQTSKIQRSKMTYMSNRIYIFFSKLYTKIRTFRGNFTFGQIIHRASEFQTEFATTTALFGRFPKKTSLDIISLKKLSTNSLKRKYLQ